ncbi:MAG: 2-hydroxyacyl-CoA dehydratase, partial [Oscillospiraceae bacterium]
MAELIYSAEGRLLFTEEMKKEYTILMPQMLPVHFTMMKKCLELEGYKMEMLTSNHRGIVDTGLKYVHNDTCYPALLVIGQLIEAVESGKYDPHKVALIITQTGGGCRASNYIHLLRKALKKAELEFIPVISLNLSGLDKNPGFKLSLKFFVRMVYAVMYGDLIVQIANQCRPYEVNEGQTDKLVWQWVDRLVEEFKTTKGLGAKGLRRNMEIIADDFAALPIKSEKKIKVGVVGEIYIKYSPLGNNNLEEFLLSENCEPVVPGLIDFVIFKVDNRIEDIKIYGGSIAKKLVCSILKKFISSQQSNLIEVIASRNFRAPESFSNIKQ